MTAVSFIWIFDPSTLQNISCSSWLKETLRYILSADWRCMLKYFISFLCAVLIVATSWAYTIKESKKQLSFDKENALLLYSVLDKITDSNWKIGLRGESFWGVWLWGKWHSCLRYDGIGGFLVETPLDAEPGLATKPHYKAPSYLQVKNC